LSPYWNGGGSSAVVGVVIAFLLNMLLRCPGVVPLLARRGLRLEPTQWLLLGGLLAGVVTYFTLTQPSSGNQYFLRSGFTYGVVLSAWGFVEVLDRARMSRSAQWTLAAGTALYAAALVAIQFHAAKAQPPGDPFAAMRPILSWAGVLALAALICGVLWHFTGYAVPALRGRGGVVLLAFILVAGAPGLVMDERKSVQSPNGGAYALISMPKSRVDAARYVRDHSAPDDIVATNVHCLAYYGTVCDPREFWLAAYSERSVLVEGWGFAPRVAENQFVPFWDQQQLATNDAAIAAPTPDNIAQMKAWGVRWLVVDRTVSPESPDLARFATLDFDNGRMAVYALR
jgi:hypothetical protein